MKQTNLYEIRDKALKSGRAVFSVQQLANLIGKPKAIATVYLSRLVKKNLAKKLIRGKITFVEDDFVIASQLFEPAYVSFASALNIHGLIQQMPSRVECAATKNSRDYKTLGIRFHRIPVSLFFGFEKVKKAGSYMLLASKEKAVIDSVYLNRMPNSTLEEIKDQLDKKTIDSLLSRYSGRGKKKLEKAFL